MIPLAMEMPDLTMKNYSAWRELTSRSHYAVCATFVCFNVYLAFDDVVRKRVQLALGSFRYKVGNHKRIPI